MKQAIASLMPQSQLCLSLITSTGTQLFAGLVPVGFCTPTPFTITLTAPVEIGAIAATVQPLPTVVPKGNRLKFGVTTLVLAEDGSAGATTLFIEPASAAIASGSSAQTFALLELLGGESLPFQGSTELNQVTLLNSGGWMSKSASQSQWNFQFTGYIPVDSSAAAGYRLIQSAWTSKRYIFLERYLANGDRFAGTAIVTAFSDQVQGAGYVQWSCTFEGHEAPTRSFGDGLLVQAPSAPPEPAPEPTASPSGAVATVGEPIILTAVV